MDNRSEWSDVIYGRHSSKEPKHDPLLEEKDMGGRLTPDDLLPWYEKFDVTANVSFFDK